MVLRSQADTLPNQSIYNQPVHSKKSILREVMKQSGGVEVVLSAQIMPLTPAISVIASFLMSPLITYTILTFTTFAIIWKKSDPLYYYSQTRYQ
jgi:hypothetical protein